MDGMEIIDVSDPTNPALLGKFSDDYNRSKGVYVSGNIAYAADRMDGLEIIDPGLDNDDDYLTNVQEIYFYFTNVNNPDTDFDNIPDGWEGSYGLNPLLNDSSDDPDIDGLLNLEEYNIGTFPDDSDSDDDNMPDGWEVSNSLDPLLDDSSVDPDNDNLSNLGEYTSTIDPRDPDSDDDILDGEEVVIGVDGYITDPNDPDTDDDGYYDGYEIQKGTDPLDPNDYPKREEDIWQNLLEEGILIPVVGGIATGVVGIGFFFVKRKLKKRAERVVNKE